MKQKTTTKNENEKNKMKIELCPARMLLSVKSFSFFSSKVNNFVHTKQSEYSHEWDFNKRKEYKLIDVTNLNDQKDDFFFFFWSMTIIIIIFREHFCEC